MKWQSAYDIYCWIKYWYNIFSSMLLKLRRDADERYRRDYEWHTMILFTGMQQTNYTIHNEYTFVSSGKDNVNRSSLIASVRGILVVPEDLYVLGTVDTWDFWIKWWLEWRWCDMDRAVTFSVVCMEEDTWVQLHQYRYNYCKQYIR